MTDHLHTRSDYRHTYSPRRIQLLPVRRSLSCTPAIERRVRKILTWHAGDCGLIDRRALQYLAELYFAGEVTTRDLIKLASRKVYEAIAEYINFICTGRKQLEG